MWDVDAPLENFTSTTWNAWCGGGMDDYAGVLMVRAEEL